MNNKELKMKDSEKIKAITHEEYMKLAKEMAKELRVKGKWIYNQKMMLDYSSKLADKFDISQVSANGLFFIISSFLESTNEEFDSIREMRIKECIRNEEQTK